ncbi:hypothetical protein [Actinomadura hibisca]|uniref:hypothetical protein n=1 Tax=Actinomadura hibisca TaxID=68565 RepID=UPI00082D9C6D|nr:hypothetical protein [Actinomadura hibisca]
MSNGARHGLGVLLGLIATPVLALGLAFGLERVLRAYQMFQPFSERAVWVLVLVGVGLLAGLLAGSRVSPLASLVPGVALTAYGTLWQVSLERVGDLTDPLPDRFERGFNLSGGTGFVLLLGVVLVAASLPPSRWKGRPKATAQPRHAGPPAGPPEPLGPPPGPPQYGRQQLPQYEQNPRLGPPPGPGQGHAGQGASGHDMPGQGPYGQGGPEQDAPGQGAYGQGAYGQGAPGPGDRPPLGAVPFGEEPKPRKGDDDDDPGEWTQMYGGRR